MSYVIINNVIKYNPFVLIQLLYKYNFSFKTHTIILKKKAIKNCYLNSVTILISLRHFLKSK